jgi:hypothetical protein
VAGKSAILTVKILSDASKAAAGMDQATGKVSKFQSGLSKGAKIGGAALLGLGAAATKATLAAEEVASANARVGQTLENAGMGKATDRVLAYAESLEGTLGVDEKVIKNTQAKLGTFHELASSADEAGGAFDRATLAAMDMAAAGFGDAESNAVQLGKALQDPVKGITALNKSGVTFTDEQKKMVKSMQETGDMAGAQDLILSELEGQVGGTAEATADSSAKMSLAFADVGEKIGSALLPVLDQLAPIIQNMAAWMSDNTTAVLALGGVIAGLAAAFVAANAALKIYQAAMLVWNGVTKAATIAQRALNLVMKANPIGLVITAVTLLIAGIMLLWNKNEGFRNFVTGAWKAIQKVAVAVWNAIKAAVLAVLNWITTKIGQVKTIITAAWNLIRTTAVKAWNGVRQAVATVASWITTKINQVKAIVTAVWSAIRSSASTAWNGVKSAVSSVVNSIKSIINSIKGAASSVWNSVKSAATSAFNAILSPVRAVQSAFNRVVDAVRSLIGWIGKIKMPKIDIPKMPWQSTPPPSVSSAPAYAGVGTYRAGGGATGSYGGGGITINVSGVLDGVDAARRIKRVLRTDARRRGGVVIDRPRRAAVAVA